MPTKKELNRLVDRATGLGATAAGLIRSADIVVEDDLARICGRDPRCESFGLAPSCPPHVPGPPGFRKWQALSSYAVAVRIDIPSAAMFSDERREVMQLLHEIVAGVEAEAYSMGYRGSKAFAGGSCKKIFCHDHAACRVLSEKGACRNPRSARPSMSGFGVNVAKLMQAAGWPAKMTSREEASDEESMTWVAGLVLISEFV
jgi:predicted metal-binding protein